MKEIQPISNKRTSRIVRYGVRGGALSAVAGLAIVGGGRARAENQSPIVDNQDSNVAENCIPTDLKGHFEFTDADKNIVGNPSRLHLENVQPLDRQFCDDNVWIRSFGSTQNPYSSGWLENQDPITSQITIHNNNGTTTLTSTAEGMVTIPNNTNDLNVDINVTETKYCWVQIEAVRTSVIDPKVYSGVNMINYALYPNPDMDSVTCQPKPTVTLTSTPEPECIASDVKGEFEDENHYSNSPVKGIVSNVAKELACSDDIYVHMYGSMQAPETSGWLQSQKGNHIKTIRIDVPEGTVDKPIEISVPNTEFCWVQVDLTRDGEIKDEPRYIDNDYVFVKDADSCLPATASPTATFTPAATKTETSKSTKTPRPTETPKPVDSPTTIPTAKATESPVPAKISPNLPKTGSGSKSQDISGWILFGATAMGVLGLTSIKSWMRRIVIADEDNGNKNNKGVK